MSAPTNILCVCSFLCGITLISGFIYVLSRIPLIDISLYRVYKLSVLKFAIFAFLSEGKNYNLIFFGVNVNIYIYLYMSLNRQSTFIEMFHPMRIGIKLLTLHFILMITSMSVGEDNVFFSSCQ